MPIAEDGGHIKKCLDTDHRHFPAQQFIIFRDTCLSKLTLMLTLALKPDANTNPT